VGDVDGPGRGRLGGMLRRAVKHRLTASMLALLLVVLAAACGDDHNDRKGAGQTTTTTKASTTAPSTPSGSAAGGNNISIFASTEVAQALEQLTSTYKSAHPEVTFQVTTGNTSQLVDQISKGARPNVYIDEEHALGRVSKSLVQGTPALFGTDIPVAIVQKGNPKGARWAAFAPQPATTSGMCSTEVPCGVFGRYYLTASKIQAVPDVIESDENALVNGVADGNIDIALVMRSASRNRFFKVSFLVNYYGPKFEANYKMATITDSPQAQDFLQYVTTFDAARKILVARGFLSFYALNAPAASTTTTTAAAAKNAAKNAATSTTKKP
jgi:molybdate transport system substrate-binding protein